MNVLYLIGAVIFICAAHFVRVYRWKLFIEIYEKPNTARLTQALAMGYILNFFVPYKLGDLFRAWFAGRKLKNRQALSFSTVILDRYLDVLCVGIIFAVFLLCGYSDQTIRDSALFYVHVSAILILATVLLYALRAWLKKFLLNLSSLFNDSIKTWLLEFGWALISNLRDIFRRISFLRLFISTIGMWSLYLLSYFLFGEFLSMSGTSVSVVDVFTTLFAQNGIKASTSSLSLFGSFLAMPLMLYMAVYTLSPLLIMIAWSLFRRRRTSGDMEASYVNLLPHLDPQERLRFLESYFSGSSRKYIADYLKINQNISIIRDYSAGSNATTMLCTDSTTTFFRKYAFGDDGKKLYEQICWLEDNRPFLPLPDILREEHNDIYCYYDMPFINGAAGLFEFVHSTPPEESWEIIRSALDTLENTIYQRDIHPADAATIHAYYTAKVQKNLDRIKSSLRIAALLSYKSVYINGVEYPNLSAYEDILSEKFLQCVFQNDSYAVIHGDLTIENIICRRETSGQTGYYLIDPNTGNIHNSPNLDYAKLLQSIHGGYEFLMAVKGVYCEENRIQFMYTKSAVYDELHAQLRSYMLQNFSEERVRSIYFHEIVHWLRLMPYKIEKAGKRVLVFYAGLLMILKDIAEIYGEGSFHEENKTGSL